MQHRLHLNMLVGSDEGGDRIWRTKGIYRLRRMTGIWSSSCHLFSSFWQKGDNAEDYSISGLSHPCHSFELFARRRQWLVEKGYTQKEFLAICCSDEQPEGEGSGEEKISLCGFTSSSTVPLGSSIHVSVDSMRRNQRIRVLQNAMKEVLRSFAGMWVERVFCKTRELVEWRYVLSLVLCWCDLPDGKNIAEVRHGITLKIRFVGCMVIGKDIISGQMGYQRSLRETKVSFSSLQNICVFLYSKYLRISMSAKCISFCRRFEGCAIDLREVEQQSCIGNRQLFHALLHTIEQLWYG